jgi:hypothetical protein
MYVVDFTTKSVTTVSVVPSKEEEENPTREWVALGPAGKAPAVVEDIIADTPPAMRKRIWAGVNTPFTLALGEPGHPLLPTPKALPDVDDLGEYVVVLGDRFYASATVRGKYGKLVEIDPTTGTTRVLPTKGAMVSDVYPAGDQLAILVYRKGRPTIGLYDVAAERFTVEVTLPSEARRRCERRGPIQELGIFWLAVSPDATGVRATFSCYVND